MMTDNLATRVALLESHVEEIKKAIEKGQSQKVNFVIHLLRILSVGLLLTMMWIANLVLAKIGIIGPP